MGPIDFNGLDTAVHGPIRLGVLTALQITGSMNFSALKKRLQVTDGSLGMHLQKLEEKRYITARKEFINRRPRTTYELTPKGRKSLAKYLESMQRLLEMIERQKK